MISHDVFNEVLTSFVGGLVALFFVVFVWIIKSAYTKHRKELMSLAKLERTTVINFEALIDNLEFIKKWINLSSENRPFSYDFAEYILLVEETYNLSNLKTINEVLPVFYRLERSNKDLKNMYTGYWDAVNKIDLIGDEQEKKENFEALFLNVKTQLEVLIPNYNILQKKFTICNCACASKFKS